MAIPNRKTRNTAIKKEGKDTDPVAMIINTHPAFADFTGRMMGSITTVAVMLINTGIIVNRPMGA